MELIKYKDNHSEEELTILYNEIEELHSLHLILVEMVGKQQDELDTLESNIEDVTYNVEVSNVELIQVHKLKYKYKPILVGGVIGGAVFGPIGILTGFKLAGVLTCITGTCFGGFMGKKAKDVATSRL
jgi:syntaxin 17